MKNVKAGTIVIYRLLGSKGIRGIRGNRGNRGSRGNSGNIESLLSKMLTFNF